MLILYLALVLSMLALLGVAVACYFRVRKHLRRRGQSHAAARQRAVGVGLRGGEHRPEA